jgi:CheY-like chemotaxis protein
MKPVLRILLAEDNADDVFLLRQALKKIAWTPSFHVVPDGVEAIAYLEGAGDYENRGVYPFPDVLLLDLNMPRRNGFEVLEWIRKDSHCHDLVVHVLSASARPADVKRAYDLNANSYVVKPTSMDELIAFMAALRAWHEFMVFAPTTSDQKLGAVFTGLRSSDSGYESRAC